MKALSVKQPWAWAIVHGYKPIENRDRGFSFRGPLLIHAGKEDAGYAAMLALRRRMRAAGEDDNSVPELTALPKGGIVGRAVLAGTLTASDSPWFEGPVGLVLADAEPLRLIPWPGQLGLFDIPDTALTLSLAPDRVGQAELFPGVQR